MSNWYNLDRRQKHLLTKKVVTAFLVICILQGLATIMISSYLSSSQINCLHTQAYNAASYLGIFLGLAIILSAVHTLTKVKFTLICEMFRLFIIEIVFLTLGYVVITITAHIYRKKVINNELFDDMLRYMQQFPTDAKNEACWNSMQSQLWCCGLRNYSDWTSITLDYAKSVLIYNSSLTANEPTFQILVPNSCICNTILNQNTSEVCVQAGADPEVYYFVQACYPKYEKIMLFNTNFLRVYCPTLLCFQIVQFFVMFFFVAKVNNVSAVQQVYTVS